MTLRLDSRPGLRRGVKLAHDPVRDRMALLYPEGVLLLNETAAAVLGHCDGQRTVPEVAEALSVEYDDVSAEDVLGLLADLDGRRLLVHDGTGRPAEPFGPELPAGPAESTGPAEPARAPVPLGMLAEVTYRCPLHCTYCSNPVNLADYQDELGTGDWLRVLEEARALGVLQVHFSGGEPMLRRDLSTLVSRAHALGMYSNLVTSGIPMKEADLAALAAAGLDHFQLSIQDSLPTSADAIAGLRGHERKLQVAEMVRAHGLPLTVNVVLHRANVERLLPIAELAVSLGAERLELAHTQFYGWALKNRAALMPSREQVERATRDAAVAKERYGDSVEIVHVVADYHDSTPKPCMYGWGSRQFVVAPNGDVLPCLSAAQLPGLGIVNVRAGSLDEIWYKSPAFNRFRGTGWMPEPCQSCALKEVDFGGCRCQAYQLLGDAGATDPVCSLSPHHDVVTGLTAAAAAVPVPRRSTGPGRARRQTPPSRTGRNG
jgi:pyrroloquinoline quinone biosynthesis protein E